MTVEKITDDSFLEGISSGVCIVDFYADWCGPCRAIAPLLEKMSKDFEGKIKIYKLNVDENQKIASEHGIRSIPTMIAFEDGKKVETKVGGMDESSFKSWINSLLA